MNYKPYQHIEKLGTMEVEGILEGFVHLSYKIDGTNGCIFLKEDGSLGFGSRKRDLSLGEDNNGFRTKSLLDKEFCKKLRAYFAVFPNHILYGEYLVPVYIKRYKKDAWNKFYIFDVFDVATLAYLPFDAYTPLLKALGLLYIPEIAVLENPSAEDIKALLPRTGEFLLDNGPGEGIVIKNYEYRNRYGRQTWAKLLTEDFSEHKRKTRVKATKEKAEHGVERDIINMMSIEHVYKEKAKLEEKYGGWSSEFIFELLNRVFLEFWKDNGDAILFRKMKFPTVNFKVLKRLSDEKVKEILGL